MTLYLDNDVISKLAACDLLNDAILTLGKTTDDVRILSTLKFRYGLTDPRRRAKRERELGSETLGRIDAFVKATGEIEPADPVHLQAFKDVLAIDPGEAQLFSSAVADANGLVVTGDKRSIISLSTATTCVGIADALKGRVICFEQLMKQIIAVHGFDTTKRKVVPAVDCDTALRSAFGSGLDAKEEQVLRVLNSYVDELRASTDDLLAPDIGDQ